MRMRRLAIGVVMVLGLVVGAAGAFSATGEETKYLFYQAGEPYKHPSNLIETTMVGHGAFSLDQYGNPDGAASGTIVYHESNAIGADLELTLSVDHATLDASEIILRVSVEKSNPRLSSCPSGSTGDITLRTGAGGSFIVLAVCGRDYIYKGTPAPRSRVKVTFEKPQREDVRIVVELRRRPVGLTVRR